MDDDLARLFAGHMGTAAVLVNVLIDKGVVGTQELSDRLGEAHIAASGCAGGSVSGHPLAEMIRYVGGTAGKGPQ